jgi:hypothetical protein
VNRCTDLKHGVCKNGTCVCAPGFAGADCSVPQVGSNETHQCVVKCNTGCNAQCGRSRALKGQAFYIKCMQMCLEPCKDSCKDKADSRNFARKNASQAAKDADLAHSQRDGGGPQPNEVRPH